MPDGGSARADFPGGDARTLYRSIKRVLALPPETRLFICHDYGPNGRDIAWETTVGSERAHNIHLKDGISEDEFVKIGWFDPQLPPERASETIGWVRSRSNSGELVLWIEQVDD